MAAPVQPGYIAGGNISPRRFVYLSDEWTVTQCGAGTRAIGISGHGDRYAPGTAFDSGTTAYAATAGQYLLVYPPGYETVLEAGLPITVATENRLKSDANGRGIPVTTSGDKYGALALENASASGQIIRVAVVDGEMAVN
jgi:hypothetical protein